MDPYRKPVCFSNGTTHAVRLYLRNLSLSPGNELYLNQEETLEEIASVVNSDPGSKWLSHNVLFLHLGDPKLARVKEDLKYFSLVNLSWSPIPECFYIDLIFECQLHEYFLQMVYAGRARNSTLKLLTLAVDKVVSNSLSPDRKLNKSEWMLYLSVLPRVCSSCSLSKQQQDLYRKSWKQLFSHFLDLPNEEIPLIEKVEALVRVAGIVSSLSEDYEGSSEISDSIQELKFDPMMLLDQTWSSDFYGDLFAPKTLNIRDFSLLPEIFEDITSFILTLNLSYPNNEDSEVFLRVRTKIPRKKSLTWRYVGDCAYLANLIFNKNILLSEVVPQSIKGNAKNIQVVTKYLEEFKSKSRYEDYNDRTMTFQHFCTLLEASVKNRHSQTSWYEKFLTYDESLSTLKGFEIAQELITPNVSVELGSKMLKKILRMVPLVEEVKKIALTLIFNENMYPEFSHSVDILFKAGLHDGLCTTEFQETLNDLNMRLGSEGTLCPRSHQLSPQVIKEWRRVTLQNPSVAIKNLLLRLLQVPAFGSELIMSLKPIWKLFSATIQQGDQEHPLNLLEASVREIIDKLSDPMERSLHQKFVKFLPTLLQFVPKEKLQGILLQTFVASMEKSPSACTVAILELYESLLANVLALSSMNEKTFLEVAYSHAVGIREATYCSNMESYDIRDKAIDIITLLRKHLPQDQVPATSENLEQIKSLPTAQLILLYTRDPKRQPLVEHLLSQPHCEQRDTRVTTVDLEDVIQASSPKEWSDILKILFSIMSIQANGCSNSVASQQFLTFVTQAPLFEVDLNTGIVLEEEEDKKRKDAASGRSRKAYPIVFSRFGSFLVDVLTSPEDPYGFQSCPKAQLELLETLVAVSCHFPDEPQYYGAKQLTLMSLLTLVTKLVPRMEEGLREQCLLITLALKKTPHVKLGPICTSIIDILNPQTSSIVPV